MHKTFKNQKRYKLDKHQLNQESTHKCDKKENCPNYIKNPNQHMIEDTTLKRCQMKVRYQLMKIPSRNKPNPLHFSWWHKVPRREMFVFQGDTSSGSNTNRRQLMFTNIYDCSPKICALFMILHLNTNCTQMGSSLSIHIIQTLVMFKESNKMQNQFKEWCSTQCRIASPRIVHYQEVWLLNVNAQKWDHCFSQRKKTQSKFWVEQKDPKDARKTNEPRA